VANGCQGTPLYFFRLIVVMAYYQYFFSFTKTILSVTHKPSTDCPRCIYVRGTYMDLLSVIKCFETMYSCSLEYFSSISF
jgi:hypothetical protein